MGNRHIRNKMDEMGRVTGQIFVSFGVKCGFLFGITLAPQAIFIFYSFSQLPCLTVVHS